MIEYNSKILLSFATLADEFSDLENYTNIIRKLNSFNSTNLYRIENPDIDYIYSVILSFSNDHLLLPDATCKRKERPKYEMSDHANQAYAIELNRLIDSFKKDHYIVKFFQHLSVLLFLKDISSYLFESSYSHTSKCISSEIFSTIPLSSINFEENKDVVNDFSSMFKKYPHLFSHFGKFDDEFKECFPDMSKYNILKTSEIKTFDFEFLKNFLRYDDLKKMSNNETHLFERNRVFVKPNPFKYDFFDLEYFERVFIKPELDLSQFITHKTSESGFFHGYEFSEYYSTYAIVSTFNYIDFARKSLAMLKT